MLAFRKSIMPTIRFFAVQPEILKPERFSDTFIESLMHGLARQLFENSSKRIEIPVVITPEGSWRMGVALFLDHPHPGRLVARRMIDARTRGQEIINRCLPLDFAQAFIVINAQLLQRQAKIDGSI